MAEGERGEKARGVAPLGGLSGTHTHSYTHRKLGLLSVLCTILFISLASKCIRLETKHSILVKHLNEIINNPRKWEREGERESLHLPPSPSF